MSDEFEIIARNGNVCIPTRDSDGDRSLDEYTPEAARALAIELIERAAEAECQRAAIAVACAQGHTWNSGYNSTVGDKTTVYHCTREGCQGRKEEPGWLPFEPKQHIVPYSPKLWDCTGPGCQHCENEAFADHMGALMTDAMHRLAPELSAFTAAVDTMPLLQGTPAPDRWAPIVAQKIAHTWSVDATPEQVQAALDARKGGTDE